MLIRIRDEKGNNISIRDIDIRRVIVIEGTDFNFLRLKLTYTITTMNKDSDIEDFYYKSKENADEARVDLEKAVNGEKVKTRFIWVE